MKTTAARVGRERTCNQCGAVYRSPRSTSLYCSTPCRKKAARGTAPTGGPRSGPETWHLVSRLLLRLGFIGRVGPLSRRDQSPPVYALLVDPDATYAEAACQYNQRGWGSISRDELSAALKADGIQGFATRSPEAAAQKQWKDRQRQRESRQREALAA
jgi:hypothetical protein